MTERNTETYWTDTILDLRAKGYRAVMPIPAGRKMPPPSGATGAAGRIRKADVDRWLTDRAEGFLRADLKTGELVGQNLAWRVPKDHIILDVDAYGDKPGLETLAALTEDLGELPATWGITGRHDGSVKLVYRARPVKFIHAVAGIEILQHSHRFTVLPGSWTELTKGQGDLALVRWVEWHPDGTMVDLDEVPALDEVPDLPHAWQEYLAAGPGYSGGSSQPVSPEWRMNWFATEGPWDDKAQGLFRRTVLEPFKAKVKRGESRHDAMVSAVNGLVEDAVAGLYDRTEATNELAELFERVMKGERNAASEMLAAIDWKLANLKRSTESTAPPEGEQAAYGQMPVLAPEFWDQHPVLTAIRSLAHTWEVGPDAVLANELALVTAATSHRVRMKTFKTGERNLFFGVVGAPSAGKTQAARAARAHLELPDGAIEVDEFRLSTEPGLVAAFGEKVEQEVPTGGRDKDGNPKMKTVERWEQTRHSMHAFVDEGEAFIAKVGDAARDDLGSTIRTLWSGGKLGHGNATEELRRSIPAQSYVVSMVINVQPEKLVPFLADAGGGTPARFVWVSAEDPLWEEFWWDEQAVEVKAAPWSAPDLRRTKLAGVEIERDRNYSIPDEALALRKERIAARRKGGLEPLLDVEAHWELTLLKLAVAFAIRFGDPVVSMFHVELATQVMAVSSAIVDWMRRWQVSKVRAAGRRAAVARATDSVYEGEVREAKLVESGARTLARKLEREGGTITTRDAHNALRSQTRRELGGSAEAIELCTQYGADKGWFALDSDGTISLIE